MTRKQTLYVNVNKVDQMRIYWRGSGTNTRYITPVDVIAYGAIEGFVRGRASDVLSILETAKEAIPRIEKAFTLQEFDEVKAIPVSRGFVGLPPLLAELWRLDRTKRDEKVKK
jgi:hypothetical protein